ncbi:amino acid racemase [Croceicoccus sp. F390]|uniref:Amino acid racemase n=1 Tax=Croceicoccus esteveae TaxID=3075597 RepID=A0ABU2ZEI7_9SPHN|nr:amino acid racemase [Croceicoccus sp. F390]MDT0575018.1 amino acid racemase [Croceicoccus sp. F390]
MNRIQAEPSAQAAARAEDDRPLRKLGLIGGMSWVSTQSYYQTINRVVQKHAGTNRSAPILIESLDFGPLYRIGNDEQHWQRAAEILSASARRLEGAGAGAIVIAANSMHRIHAAVTDAVTIPVFHIADCVAARMRDAKVECAALIGSANVMTEDFYRDRLIGQGVTLLPPDTSIIERLDAIIYGELMLGKVTRSAERELKTIMASLTRVGAQAVVLGCTELELIVDVNANILPVFDGAHIHATAAAEWILGINQQ